MVYDKVCRMTFFFLIIVMSVGTGCSCRKKSEQHIPLKIENISKISCSVMLKYPPQEFDVPAGGGSFISNIFQTRISTAIPVKGAPFFSIDILCEDNTIYKVAFLVIDDGVVLVQCDRKKFFGKMNHSDFRELVEFLGKINPSIVQAILSNPEIYHRPYNDLNIMSWKFDHVEDSNELKGCSTIF